MPREGLRTPLERVALAQLVGGCRISPADLMSWVEELILLMGTDCRNPETGLAGGAFCNYSSPTPLFVLCIFPSLGCFHHPVPCDNKKSGVVAIACSSREVRDSPHAEQPSSPMDLISGIFLKDLRQ